MRAKRALGELCQGLSGAYLASTFKSNLWLIVLTIENVLSVPLQGTKNIFTSTDCDYLKRKKSYLFFYLTVWN
jgi:hypothetical protein